MGFASDRADAAHLAKSLHFVNILIATIVSSAWQPF